jgi:hypothetical protein
MRSVEGMTTDIPAPDTPRLDEYLARYAAALTAFDAETSASLWSTPGMIVDDRAAGVLDSHEAMVQGLEQSYPLYQKLGLSSVGHELLDAQQLSPRLVLVRVRWLFRDAEEALLTDSTSFYLLRDGDDGLRACVCVETDAAEKLGALAAEKGVDLG